MEYYNYLKSLHLIFNYLFAGLFYTPFVYQIEAADKPSPEKEILQKQYKIMTYRLWYIIWPSAVLAVFFFFDVVFHPTATHGCKCPGCT
jgi:putative membrane protein